MLLKSRVSGPPYSGSNPPGAAATTSTNLAATSRVSTGWNFQANGTASSPGTVAKPRRNTSIRV